MFSLTPKQEVLIEKLKENIADVLQRDSYFEFFPHRWLIARSWNVRKAEEMLRESAEWRRKNRVSSILTTWKAPEVIAKYSPGGLVGFDKERSPVWIEAMGNIDVKGLMASSKLTDMIRNRIYVLENCDQLVRSISEQKQRYTGGITMIYDFEHFGLKHLWKPGVDHVAELFTISESNYPELLKICFIVNAIEFVSQLFYMSETYYPEQLKAGYVLNAPKLFYVAFNIIRPFLHEESRKKIHILGHDWKERLLEVIDASQLPVHWGGTMIDPDGDEYCQSKVCIGGQVPTSYYCRNTYLNNPSELSEIVITRRSTHKIELFVDAPMSIIRWQFYTELKDIGFGIFLKTKDQSNPNTDDMDSVLDNRRVNSHMVPEEGSLIAEEPGTYVFRFDNKYSWISNKKLFYHVDVLPPSEELQT